MSEEHGPTVRQRRLTAELRKLRERAGLSPENAAGLLQWSRSKLVMIETGKRMPSVADVTQIVDTYGGTGQALRLALVKLAQDLKLRGWWAAYGDILDGSYVECEDKAVHIRSYQIHVIPGLLQTPAYSLWLMRANGVPEDEIDRRVQARMTRQVLLVRQDPPQLHVLLEEGAIRAAVGEPGVMREQLEALIAAGRRPNISIRVIPQSAGPRPGMGGGPFVSFSFESLIETDVVYIETIAGGLYLEEVAQVQRCNVLFQRIADMALSEEESADLIASIIRDQPHSI